MAVAPGYLRQIGLPTTTGQRGLPSVQINDYIGQAGGKGASVFGAIGDQLTQAQADSDVSMGKVNATLKLSALETEMSSMDGLPAAIDEHFQTKKAEIFATAGSHIIDKRARKTFENNYAVLAAQSELSIKAAGTKRKFERLEGDLNISLGMYERGVATVRGVVTKVNVDTAIRMGADDINKAVQNGIIKADVGSKKLIKFIDKMADNAVVSWLNGPIGGTMRSKLLQMESGKLADPDMQKYWDRISGDERKKANLISQAIMNISRKLIFGDKKKKSDKAALKSTAMQLQLEFYKPNTDQNRKSAILEELSKNVETSPAAYNSMVQDLSGRTARFDDTKAGSTLLNKLIRTPHLVSVEDIINSNLSNTNELLKLHGQKIDTRTAKAKAMLLVEPGFIATNRRDKRSDVLGVAQAEIWTTILYEQADANDKGKSYDPIKRAKELIKEFKSQQDPDAGKAGATEFLRILGITKKQDVEVFINAHIADGLPMAEINHIRAMGALVF